MSNKTITVSIKGTKGSSVYTADWSESLVRQIVEGKNGKLSDFQWEIFKDFIAVSGEVII